VHAQSRGTYGVRRVQVEVNARREAAGTGPVNRKKVERLMREHRIQGRRRRRRVSTTIQDPAAVAVPDRVGRDFAASRPDEKWCGDITYVPVGQCDFGCRGFATSGT
jgi:transposase InsO family protein